VLRVSAAESVACDASSSKTMRVSWEPAASTPRSVALSGGVLMAAGNDVSSAGGSCGSSFAGTFVTRKNKSLPVQGSAPSPALEVEQLRGEVARLRAAAQRDAKERETLRGMVDCLKTQLRHALDENRSLTDGLEERKQMLDAQSARREAAARESALNSAKELFKSMLEDAENGRASTENRNTNRDHAKAKQASLPSHKRRPLTTADMSPPSGTTVH